MGLSSDACLKRAFKPYKTQKQNPYRYLDWLVISLFVFTCDFTLSWYYFISMSLACLLALTLNVLAKRWERNENKKQPNQQD
jgi:hypothetical protein